MLETNKIHQIDALEGLKELPDNFIDLIVTDPPYQLSSTSRARTDQTNEGSYGREVPFSRQQSRITGFMGKEWDVLPKQEIWNEMLRVLKAGSFAFILMTPRQDSQYRTIMMLEKAGFNIGFTPLYWAYASGFPKSENISLIIDKRECKKQLEKKIGRKLHLKDEKDKELFKEAWKEFREVVGKKSRSKNFESALKNKVGYLQDEANKNNTKCFGYGEEDITFPFSPQAKALDGSYGGFQPKPAVEIILVAMKPITEKTYVEQALKNKKGITWLDDCRVPYESEDDKYQEGIRKAGTELGQSSGWNDHENKDTIRQPNQQGRFPANLLVSDDVLNDGVSGQTIGHNPNIKTTGYGSFGGGTSERVDYKDDTYIHDSGSFSRYFDLDKWFINKLPDNVKKTFPFLITPKASSGEKNEGLDGMALGEPPASARSKPAEGRENALGNPRANFHPTVKPIKLMSYLITLGSRENDIILDPFIGSGTTAIASRLLTRNFIGFELDKEYHKIAEARIKDYMEQTKLTIFNEPSNPKKN